MLESKQGTIKKFLVQSPIGAKVRKRPLGGTDVELQAAGTGGESSRLLYSKTADEACTQDKTVLLQHKVGNTYEC